MRAHGHIFQTDKAATTASEEKGPYSVWLGRLELSKIRFVGHMRAIQLEMASFIVAGGMGAVVSQYLHSTAASLSLDKMIAELGMVVQPFNGLRTLLPALVGFLSGTVLLLIWNFFKTRMVRYLLECNMWFLKPRHPINKV